MIDIREICEEIKGKTPYYPGIINYLRDDNIYFATKIRIKRDNIWYAILCAKGYTKDSIENPKQEVSIIYNLFYKEVYNVLYLYDIKDLNVEPDQLQIEEDVRLRIINMWEQGLFREEYIHRDSNGNIKKYKLKELMA